MVIRLMNKKHRYIHIEIDTTMILYECVKNLENNALSFFFLLCLLLSVFL